MRYYYAQIDVGGRCTAVTDTHAPIEAPNMIPVESPDPAYLGKTWNGTTWED